MSLLKVAKFQQGITDTRICKVIFREGVNLFLTLDIISRSHSR